MTKKKKHKRYRLKKKVKRNLTALALCLGLVICITLLFTVLWPKRQYAVQGVMLDKAMDIPVIQQIIPENHQNRPAIQREIHYLVIHETDNFAASATAKNHADYLCNNDTDLNSWHYTVDENEIYHHLPDEEVGWHAGDQKTENGGNMTGVGIEMCVNAGSDFEKTMDNTAKLVAVLMKEYGLKRDEIKKHQDFSGKNCPAHLLEEEDWNAFLDKIDEYRRQLE